MSEPRHTRHLKAPVGSHVTEVFFGEGLRDTLGERVSALAPARPVLVVIDQNVPKALLEPQMAHSALASAVRFEVPGGEATKTWSRLEAAMEAAIRAGCGRQSVVVGIGGGATCDFAALIAHLLGRGAPLILVPTTLLAQVDASVGGKCAINTAAGRNLVGAFHPAIDVLIDPSWLESLPVEEYRSGAAELLKTALLGDAALFREASEHPKLGLDAIYRAIAIKAQIVAEDPFEKDKRRLLNLGHTLGHALESASHFKMRHGEAVAMGIGAASRLSEAKGLIQASQLRSIADGFTAFELPFRAPVALLKDAKAHMATDKKGTTQHLAVVLLEDIGRACVQDLALEDAQNALIRYGE